MLIVQGGVVHLKRSRLGQRETQVVTADGGTRPQGSGPVFRYQQMQPVTRMQNSLPSPLDPVRYLPSDPALVPPTLSLNFLVHAATDIAHDVFRSMEAAVSGGHNMLMLRKSLLPWTNLRSVPFGLARGDCLHQQG